jgi:MFS family permease
MTEASPQRIFWVTWLGWMLDGFDSTLYVFILAPAVADLMAADHMQPTQAGVALYGGYFFSIFMLGWACSMFWGWLADRIGRVRVLCLTILVYSVFTALCGLAPGLLLFGIFRFLAGFGVGGEWAAGTPLLQESVPEHMRVRLAGWLHTATPAGGLLAALSSLLYPVLGWRGVFMIGVVPALMTIYVRWRIPEPARWRKRQVQTVALRARSLWPATLMLSCAIFGLWSSSFWAPAFIVTKVVEEGGSAARGQHLASISGLISNGGTMVACLLAPWIVSRLGSHRRTNAVFFLGAFAAAVLTYGYGARAGVGVFIGLLPLLAFFTNGVFALYSIWLPELFPGSRRAFGSGFAFSLGRILGAAGPAAVGALVGITGSYAAAILCASSIYLLGLPFIFMAPETANQPLPE